MTKKYIYIALFTGALVLLNNTVQANKGNLTIINKTSVPIKILGKKQIGIEDPIIEEFGSDQAIESNQPFDAGEFTFLLDLKVHKTSKSKQYQIEQLPTFEMQKGHAGDNLTVTISLKKGRWYKRSKDAFIASYDWSRPTTSGTSKSAKIMNRPFWHDISHLKRAAFEESLVPYIRRTYYFNKKNNNPTEEQLIDQPRQVLFSIHGTFARKSKEFYDPNDRTFKNILAYAESLGDSVEVIALEWTGKNTANARIKAGQAMAGLINTYYQDTQKYLSLNTISHSHGGNVVNVATHFIDRPLDTIVSLYTPVRTDIEWFSPNIHKFKTLYQFYSTSDHIQFIGSISISNFNWSNIKKSLKPRKFAIQTTDEKSAVGKIYNIRVEFTGISPAHVNKEAIARYLPQLIWYINRTYKINYDLDADIDPKTKEILVAIRHSISPAILNSQIISSEIKKQAQTESDASIKSQAKYLIKYQKQMGQKGWRAINLLRSGKQTLFGSLKKQKEHILASHKINFLPTPLAIKKT